MSVGLLEIKNEIADQDLKILEDGLAAHTKQLNAPKLVFTPLAILQRDATGRIEAGLYGQTLWNWLYIDSLWVDEPLRGKGMGRVLMAAAEDEAKKRGCIGVFLWTQSFDAPAFYEKLGYELYATFDDFPIGHKRFGFRKRLAA